MEEFARTGMMVGFCFVGVFLDEDDGGGEEEGRRKTRSKVSDSRVGVWMGEGEFEGAHTRMSFFFNGEDYGWFSLPNGPWRCDLLAIED